MNGYATTVNKQQLAQNTISRDNRTRSKSLKNIKTKSKSSNTQSMADHY